MQLPSPLLERPSPQLIFSSESLGLESKLFDRAPLYLGPAQHGGAGFLRVPPWASHCYLSASPQSPQAQVLSNLCLHWQADILNSPHPDGFLPFSKSIRCKSHNAVYAAEAGKLLNPQLFHQTCDHHLPEIQHLEWQGYLFSLPQWQGLNSSFDLKRELERVQQETGDLFSSQGYRLIKTISMEQAGHWALFMINYLDLMHVDPAHAETLAQLCSCDWVQSYPGLEFTQNLQAPERWSTVQQVGWKKTWGEGDGSGWNDPDNPLRGKAAFQTWGKIYREIKGDPPLGSVWATVFPQLMFEWYPGVIVMSQVFPHAKDPTRCQVYHDFYYDEDLLAHPDFIAVQQVAFHTTGDEDEEMVGSMSRNLYRLSRQGWDQNTGFVHPQLEDCSPMFYARLAEVYQALK
ncbi:hypothetical protein COW36_10905 [bacterium (Candidatus Blackallbacteria) CG17_big_fil_post_rev_8_21_14_2_50_48_46]|uniref:Aromatic-ring-hydroxylating dioxygenase alpha subunit C-terminal domain-containing protein n=1 Tax=bacterium (Candidatus Blackallbacteria) CG17_big_fil_post_rev_8_21_14_2_50_48_46 TaxID=2014261 RepID=A0A2M7G4V7_9BACT|nr:MAG: hypothetical protein COW64_20415 [bacterium (Candidatus Blackallbacteria) CG18_big_fil_WC_8_21_14_2_50_49_26]PIW16973.1 MAG: hypothetical protein COW36_10905 [bacterium (Candidatus Blackallbacteria) CG17_big_fil_post_rev_8_21_14_2_50_48_46]PIW50252.1 MAG: hypothetical protein COW20_03420 [bacterium (Candidatus Blackallbacteria) CG13_big_fil_rev_8_21_14_2_50_49_14]